MPKNGLNVALKGVDEIFRPKNPDMQSSGSRYNRFLLQSCFHSKTIHFGCKMTKKWRTLSKASRSTVC